MCIFVDIIENNIKTEKLFELVRDKTGWRELNNVNKP